MKASGKQTQENNEINRSNTFPIPYSLREIKDDISIDSNESSKLDKEQIIKQAFKFHSEGNILEAAKYYQYFINQGFKDYRVFSNYGGILKDLGKLKEAELSLRKAIKIKPDFVKTHYNLGNLLKKLGDLKEAEKSYLKAIEIKPDFANAHLNLGNLLKNCGQLKEAELSLRKAIKINPDFAEAHTNLGNILKDLGNLKEAELSLRKAIKIKPDSADAYSNLGYILKDLNRLDEACSTFNRAINLKKKYNNAIKGLGLTLFRKGQHSEGLKKIKEAEGYIKLNLDSGLSINYDGKTINLK